MMQSIYLQDTQLEKTTKCSNFYNLQIVIHDIPGNIIKLP